jgi:hypothetical protein
MGIVVHERPAGDPLRRLLEKCVGGDLASPSDGQAARRSSGAAAETRNATTPCVPARAWRAHAAAACGVVGRGTHTPQLGMCCRSRRRAGARRPSVARASGRTRRAPRGRRCALRRGGVCDQHAAREAVTVRRLDTNTRPRLTRFRRAGRASCRLRLCACDRSGIVFAPPPPQLTRSVPAPSPYGRHGSTPFDGLSDAHVLASAAAEDVRRKFEALVRASPAPKARGRRPRRASKRVGAHARRRSTARRHPDSTP